MGGEKKLRPRVAQGGQHTPWGNNTEGAEGLATVGALVGRVGPEPHKTRPGLNLLSAKLLHAIEEQHLGQHAEAARRKLIA